MSKAIALWVIGVIGLIMVVLGFFPELYIHSPTAASYLESRYLRKAIFGLVGIPGILFMILGYANILQIRRKRRHEQHRKNHEQADSSAPHDGGP